MKKQIFLAVALLSTIATSCSDYLDRQPYNKIGSDEYFSSADELQIYANGLYIAMMPSAEDLTSSGSGTADNIAVSATSSFLLPDFNVDKQSGWTYGAWTNLYRCNYFLDNMGRARGKVADEVLRHYEGVARFWRAVFYFDKVKTYGNVPWYSHPIDAKDSVQLYKTRDDRELVMDSVLADLNYACQNLQTDKNYVITRYVALALKSRVCLFEGTYRKYHATNPSTGTPWKDATGSTRFLRECVSASEELMASGRYKLNTGSDNAYRQVFQTETPNANEVILAREYNADLMATHNLTQKFNSAGNDTRRWSPTQEFVNTYLNRDGSRFTDQKDYDKKTFVDNFKNRDLRLQQTVISPTYLKNVNGTVKHYSPNWSVMMSGYQIIKFNLDDTYYEQTSRCTNAVPIFRYAEVLLNEAEAKAELGEMTDAVWNKTIRPLRERAGVDGKAPTTADPYMQAYFNGHCTDKWLLEIRRERGIELFMEADGMRYDDLMRWACGDMLANKWSSIYIGEKNKAIDSDGDGTNDLIVVDKKPSKTDSKLFYIDLSKMTYYTWKDGRLMIKNEASWTDNKYLHPIPRAALVMNPNLKQNVGWENK